MARFIEVYVSSIRELENYLNYNFLNQTPMYNRDNLPNIPLEKRKSTLLVYGLPFNYTEDLVFIYSLFIDYHFILFFR